MLCYSTSDFGDFNAVGFYTDTGTLNNESPVYHNSGGYYIFHYIQSGVHYEVFYTEVVPNDTEGVVSYYHEGAIVPGAYAVLNGGIPPGGTVVEVSCQQPPTLETYAFWGVSILLVIAAVLLADFLRRVFANR